MTFLAPWAGLIAAAIGVPLLISLYLLKLRRKPLRVSSTLLWEQAAQDLQANVPLRWLRPSWLLLVQLLALVCLLMALARPAIPGVGGIAPRTIIALDQSASMSAQDGQGPPRQDGTPRTRLDQAKQSALELLEQIRRASGRRSEVMVVGLAAQSRVLQPFTTDLRAVRDAIECVQATDQPARIDDIVRIASAATLAGSDPEAGGIRTALVLFSDGSLEPGHERLPGSIDLRLVLCGPDQSDPKHAAADNLGIVAIGARRDADNPAVARVFVRVQNAGDTAVQGTLTCRVDGESAGLLPLNIPATSVAPDGTRAPGEAAGTFELDRPQGGLAVVSIPRPDLLAADNTVGVLLRPVSKPRILVVGPNDASDPYAKARGPLGIDRFLLGVLQDLEPAELRTIDASAYAAAASAGHFAAAFGNFDLVVFDRVTPRSLPPVPSISIGAAVPIAALHLEPPSSDAQATRFISWKRNHPILKGAPLDAVLIAPPMRMTIDEQASAATGSSAAAIQSAPFVTPLALGTSGPLVALVQENDARATKRLVLAFDLVRTNWGQDVSFPVFIASAVDYLTGRGESAAGRSFTTAQPITIETAPGTHALHVTGPQDFTLEVPPAPPRSRGEVSLGIPPLCGIYACDPPAAAAPGFDRLPVNLTDARESALRTSGRITIAGRTSRSSFDPAAADAPKREIWPWFTLAAAALLTIEWFLFALRART